MPIVNILLKVEELGPGWRGASRRHDSFATNVAQMLPRDKT